MREKRKGVLKEPFFDRSSMYEMGSYNICSQHLCVCLFACVLLKISNLHSLTGSLVAPPSFLASFLSLFQGASIN